MREFVVRHDSGCHLISPISPQQVTASGEINHPTNPRPFVKLIDRLLEIVGARHSEAEYDAFWLGNSDRVFMASKLYPAMGAYLRNRRSQRVLDVGARWYTRRTRRLIATPELEYSAVDPVAAPAGLEADRFFKATLQALPARHPELRSQFDIVISFGVLGFYPMGKAERDQYLSAAAELLKDDGYFFLKFDLTRLAAMPPERRIQHEDTATWFRPTVFESLPARTFVEDAHQRYEFSVFQKTP